MKQDNATPRRPKVTCHHCQGSGRIALSDELHETLSAVRNLHGASAVTLAIPLNWKGHVTAVNNRLEDLRKLGFLRRRREGRRYIYEPAKR